MANKKPVWSIRRFRELASAVWDEDLVESAYSAAQGLARDFDFAGFHARQVCQLMDNLEFPAARPGETRGWAAMRQLFYEAEPGDKQRPLSRARFEATAHLIAFFRALHSATDLIAPLVYFGLGLPNRLPRPISERKIYPAVVRDKLAAANLHAEVVSALDRLVASHAYRYLRALVNTLKHRRLVPAGFQISFDFTGDPKYGMRIGHFSYDNESFEQCWAGEYFENGSREISARVIEIGVAVNRALEEICESKQRNGA